MLRGGDAILAARQVEFKLLDLSAFVNTGTPLFLAVFPVKFQSCTLSRWVRLD